MVIYQSILEPPENGEAWFFGDRLCTVRDGTGYRKSLYGFREEEALALECYELWQSLGLKGAPTGPHAFFFEWAPRARLSPATNPRFSSRFHGAWVAQLRPPGFYPGPVFYYDMKSAYLWAGLSQGFPTTFGYYRPGDERYVGLWQADEEQGERLDLPQAFRRGSFLVTHQDVSTYALVGRMIWGVSWEGRDEVSLEPAIERCASCLSPRSFKICSQAYWGLWGCREGVRRYRYKGGKQVPYLAKDGTVKPFIQSPPYGANLVWAALIVHAVIRRLWGAAYDAIAVSTDAMLTQTPLTTGERPGDWQLKESSEHGLWIVHENLWTFTTHERPLREWTRHAGVSSLSGRSFSTEAALCL